MKLWITRLTFVSLLIFSAPVAASDKIVAELYGAMAKRMTSGGKEKLQGAVMALDALYQPLFTLQKAEHYVESCRNVLGPQAASVYDLKIRDLRYRTQDDFEHNRGALVRGLKEIQGIDAKIFFDYHEPDIKKKLAMHRAIDDIVLIGGGYSEEQCADHTRKIDALDKGPYAKTLTVPAVAVDLNRNKDSKKVESCHILWTHREGNRTYVATLRFINDELKNNRLSIQKQVIEDPGGAMQMRAAWIDFENFNTRFDTISSTQSGSSVMGFVSETYLPDALKILRDRGPVMMFHAAGDDTGLAIQPSAFTPEIYKKVRDCIVEIEPKFQDVLDDPSRPEVHRYRPAIENPLIADDHYSIARLSSHPGAPGACALRFQAGRESGMLMTFGVLSDSYPHNRGSLFWLNGTTHTAPWIQVADTGSTLDFEKGAIFGNHYEQKLDTLATIPLLQGILAGGMTLGGVGAEYQIPPPSPDVVSTYNVCLSDLLRSME
jgi:hypothetical protein